MKPENKSPEIESFLTEMFGVDRKQSILANKCVLCKQQVISLRDELSEREYTISGLCQQCQDSVFREE